MRDKDGRRSVVTHILTWDTGYSELIIGWDDGRLGSAMRFRRTSNSLGAEVKGE